MEDTEPFYQVHTQLEVSEPPARQQTCFGDRNKIWTWGIWIDGRTMT